MEKATIKRGKMTIQLDSTKIEFRRPLTKELDGNYSNRVKLRINTNRILFFDLNIPIGKAKFNFDVVVFVNNVKFDAKLYLCEVTKKEIFFYIN